MTTSTDTPRVWIACLAAYNAGRLHGEWVDATDADEMYEAAKRIIETSPAWKLDGHAEEWAIHDYENFPGGIVHTLGEYASFETVANVGAALEEHGEAFAKWLDTLDYGFDLSADNLGEQFQEHYRGEWDSEEAYAMDLVCEMGWSNVPAQVQVGRYGFSETTIDVFDELASYIDWESIARELFRHGNYTFVDGHVFEDEI